MNVRSLRNPALLLLTAFIWGIAFVAQKDGMAYVGPFTFNSVRFLIGGVCLTALLPALDKVRGRSGPVHKGSRRTILLGGAACGTALFAAANIQQIGIAMQDASVNVGKAGFITTCYCAIVPVIGMFMGRKSPRQVWFGIALAVGGLFCLCLMDSLMAGQGLDFDRSDLVLLSSSVCWAAHILVVDHFSPQADGVRISCMQSFVAGALGVPFMFLTETPVWSDILACWLPIGYAGVVSTCIGYTLQIVGQNGVHPAAAAIIMSLESVFSVLAGYVLMPETGLTGWEIFGCVLVFAAVIIVQLAPQETASAKV